MAVKKEELVNKLKAYPPNTLVFARYSAYGAAELSEPIVCFDTEKETVLDKDGAFGIVVEWSSGVAPTASKMTVERLLSTLEHIPSNATVGIMLLDKASGTLVPVIIEILNTLSQPCVTENPVPHPGERSQICIRW